MIHGFGSYGGLFDDVVNLADKAKSGVEQVAKVGQQAVETGKQAVASGKQAVQDVKQVVAPKTSPAMPVAPMSPKFTVAKPKSWFQMAAKMPKLPVPAQTASGTMSANMSGQPVVKASKTMLYVGIAVGVLALGGAAFFFLPRSKQATANKRKRKMKAKR